MKSGFWQKIKNSARLQELLTAFQTRGAELIHGGSTAQEAALVAAAMQGGLRHAVILVEDAATRQKWEDDLRFFRTAARGGAKHGDAGLAHARARGAPDR